MNVEVEVIDHTLDPPPVDVVITMDLETVAWLTGFLGGFSIQEPKSSILRPLDKALEKYIILSRVREAKASGRNFAHDMKQKR